MAGPALGVSFCSTQHRRNDPNQKNRSCDEIEEIFTDRFARKIWHDRTHTNEPLEREKEWRRHRDDNVESAKPATAEHCECSCDECQERKSPDGCWSAETGQSSSHDSEYGGRHEGKSVAVTYSTDESRGKMRYHRHCGIHTKKGALMQMRRPHERGGHSNLAKLSEDAP